MDIIRITAWLAVTVAAGVTLPAAPSHGDDFYKNRQVTFVVSNSAGGSYDLTARLVGRHISRHIPGEPNLVPQNMPGATGLAAANYMQNIAAKDGSVICAASQSVLLRQLFGDKSVKYDIAQFAWIGSPQSSVSVIATWYKAPVKTMEDAKNQVAVIGGTTIAAGASTAVALANNLLGTQFKLALGYQGGDIDLAMERGEVDGRSGQSWAGWRSTRPDWVRDGKINILVQLGITREPELPNVPLMSELAKDEKSRQIIELFAAPISMGRPIFVMNQVPAERIALLRKAFDDTMTDPQFLADAKRMDHDIRPTSGIDLDKIVAATVATPKNVLADAESATVYKSAGR